jgi:hypothetical protein
MRSFLTFLAFVGFAFGASAAQNAKDFHFTLSTSTNDYNLLENVALNAAEALRTVTLPLGRARPELAPGYDLVRIKVALVQSAATTVVVTPSCSLDNGVTYAAFPAKACTGGACSLQAEVDTYTLSGGELGADFASFMQEYDVRGCSMLKLVFSGASGGANDLISVQAAAAGAL